ncbi:DUF1707 domain-containing protein [Mycobacterium frederiksbergense]|jgi:hypothetical protein|uniref:DUF1707 domain-containing protein n=1 Tax=Mycolicibacterium frederiksbergense TaxID=117567 RepID=A0A6H0S5Q8_9MYCO|nr:DUF1707 domain-containing protein [Mycolicibacterium frederiksbergense]MBX9921395.1 DUF1707 domain-containing protein [Mycolicibacterium frederiksbergense]MCV7044347.1 DUF1707 domain-containing protein [Mycolicibacterium frederiksbergense]MDO0974748.1 DUF1707 domain-containing protein [Mycolicibacterium frederiksbergense]QIV82833.1 DUF1707 domain-containing protein [Mycolicibacterium frederiksbergense]
MDFGQNDNLRVSNADRAHVSGLLERAVADGMITLDEFAERTDAALAARTRGELRAVLVDLPDMDLHAAQAPVARSSAQPEALGGWMTSIVRRGPWTVAPVINLNTRMCSTTLDFTSAVLPGPVVEVNIDDYLSSTELIVPAGATADLNGVDAIAGSATVKVRNLRQPDQLHVIVRGKVRMGSVSVRHPFGSWLRRLHGG